MSAARLPRLLAGLRVLAAELYAHVQNVVVFKLALRHQQLILQDSKLSGQLVLQFELSPRKST